METHVGENFDILDLPMNDREHYDLVNLRHVFGAHSDKNVAIFEEIFRSLYNDGKLLYHREVVSAMDPVVQVFDHLAGQKKEMLMFGSNNYLGFANDPAIKKRVIQCIEELGIGMAGPMILNGAGKTQRNLEQAIAKFKGHEDAMLLPTGYQANLAWITALLTEASLLLYDEGSHASVIDGIKLGKKRAFRFSGTNLSSLEHLLSKYRGLNPERDIWVCSQGVYSMTGEVADLPEISRLCKKYSAFLIIDDAHGTGVLGDGFGTAEHFGITSAVKLSMGTFSKSFAVTGGFLAGSKALINFIRFFARPYFFTAAMTPMNAMAVLAGIDLIYSQPDRVQKLHRNVEYLCRSLSQAGIVHGQSLSAIVPIYPPRADKFREIALGLHQEGLFVNPIEPPAVAVGQERFRLSVMATHEFVHLDQAVEILKTVFARFAK